MDVAYAYLIGTPLQCNPYDALYGGLIICPSYTPKTRGFERRLILFLDCEPDHCVLLFDIVSFAAILNLPPNSPDAKIFKEADDPDSTTDSPSSSTPFSNSPTGSSSSGSTDSKTDPSSNGGAKFKLSETGNMLVMMVVLMAWMFL